jgi:hypothetical protein
MMSDTPRKITCHSPTWKCLGCGHYRGIDLQCIYPETEGDRLREEIDTLRTDLAAMAAERDKWRADAKEIQNKQEATANKALDEVFRLEDA